MLITTLSFGLCYLFVYGTFCNGFVGNKVTKFTKYKSVIEGYICPADHIIFDYEENVSLARCALKCSKTSMCYGVFRHITGMRCVGCQDRFLTSDTAPLLSGTEYFRRQTYKLVLKRMPWTDAKNYCNDLGGYLAIITSQEEEQFIETSVFSAQNGSVWLGATTDASAKFFLWQDGSAVSDGYMNWKDGEPILYNPSNDKAEHCMLIHKHTSGVWRWKAKSCSYKVIPLCEFD
ncbi:hepatic lectin-like [Mercenaria mercenaria]|uniref:hepatic lectin-like n=1 Tax=Mercenaria mercenaria TaxID=6596 RepID=UPI00234EDD00|nr:hepatic lectin-like [Mercenaria mercenaria]